MSLTKLLSSFIDEKEVVMEEDDAGDIRFTEKDKEGISLKGVLQRGRLRIQREKKASPQGTLFRPSTITFNYCRRIKLVQLAGLVTLYDEVPTPKLQTVFDIGNAVHEIIQGYFWDIEILRGTFYCSKCEKTWEDKSPSHCPTNKAHVRRFLKYKEVALGSETLPIKGRADGILEIEGELHLVDIKSISNRSQGMSEMQFCFEDLADSGPKPEHVVQLHFYMWMSGIKRGHLLYYSKNKGEIKTFAIPYNEEILKPYLDEISELVEKAEKLKRMEPVELPPPCGSDKCPCDTFLGKPSK